MVSFVFLRVTFLLASPDFYIHWATSGNVRGRGLKTIVGGGEHNDIARKRGGKNIASEWGF